MKLTKQKLKQIIKEELENLSEGITPEEGKRAKAEYPKHYELVKKFGDRSWNTEEKRMLLADLIANNKIEGVEPLGDPDIAHALIYQARADNIEDHQASIAAKDD